MYFVYLLKCNDKTLYCGKTVDIEKRIMEHNGVAKGGAKYTSGRRPVKLVHLEQFETLSEALKREYAIKQLTKEEKIALIVLDKS